MGSGDSPGLQNRRAAGLPVAGGFDSHSLPPMPGFLRCAQDFACGLPLRSCPAQAPQVRLPLASAICIQGTLGTTAAESLPVAWAWWDG